MLKPSLSKQPNIAPKPSKDRAFPAPSRLPAPLPTPCPRQGLAVLTPRRAGSMGPLDHPISAAQRAGVWAGAGAGAELPRLRGARLLP